jgi:hypothetical protein
LGFDLGPRLPNFNDRGGINRVDMLSVLSNQGFKDELHKHGLVFVVTGLPGYLLVGIVELTPEEFLECTGVHAELLGQFP